MKDIKEIKWKNLESICIENHALRVVVLPQLGGKIASIYHKARGFELVAQYQKDQYTIETADDFSKGDASGFDDAFPNINPENIVINNRELVYPDHGEIWKSPLNYKIVDDTVVLEFYSESFGYYYQKQVDVQETEVVLRYHIRNAYGEKLPCLWTFHGLVQYEEDMNIYYGNEVEEFLNVFESKELGKVGECISRQNRRYDFNKVPRKSSKTMVKYYVKGPVSRGACGFRYPTQGVECKFQYDAKKLPYLGMWITAGGFRGDYNCALEPSTSYYDSVKIAKSNKSIYMLEQGKPLEFTLRITLQEIE